MAKLCDSLFGQKLLNNSWGVWSRIVMEKKERPIFSHIRSHTHNTLSLAIQNLEIKLGIYYLTLDTYTW